MCQRVNDQFIWSTEAGKKIDELEAENRSLLSVAQHLAWKLDLINDKLLDSIGAGCLDLKPKDRP